MKIEVGSNDGQEGPVNRPERVTYSPNGGTTSSNTSGDGGCDIWSRIKCCFCFWVILPIILIIIGMLTVGAENYRVQRIENYNTRAKEWNEVYSNSFAQASFQLAKNTSSSQFEKRSQSAALFPVADGCDSKGDPEGGCVSTTSHSFYSTYDTPTGVDYVSISIKNSDNSEIYSARKPVRYYEVHSRGDMNCRTDVADSESESCYKKCINMNGEYNDYKAECRVSFVLTSFCLRVSESTNGYSIDKNSTIFGSKQGCYYSSDYEPFVYSKQWNVPSFVPIEVRHRMDPVISASEYTRGCSDSYLSKPKDANCFGVSKSDQVGSGITCIVIGVVIIAIDVIVVIALCSCCKNLISSFKKPTLPTTNLPVAQPPQPGYGAPAQPMYGAPTQPYGPQYNQVPPNPYGQYGGQPMPNQGYANPAMPVAQPMYPH